MTPSSNHPFIVMIFVHVKNITLKEYIEVSFKKEVAEQLQLNNNAMMEIINQRFILFQSVRLQTMTDLVLQIVHQLANH